MEAPAGGLKRGLAQLPPDGDDYPNKRLNILNYASDPTSPVPWDPPPGMFEYPETKSSLDATFSSTRMPAENVQVSSPDLTTRSASELEFCFSDPNSWDGNAFRSDDNIVSELEKHDTDLGHSPEVEVCFGSVGSASNL